jgi:hypothetical protein
MYYTFSFIKGNVSSVVNIEDFFKLIRKKSFPLKTKDYIIDEIEACSANSGCASKGEKTKHKDHLVGYRSKTDNIYKPNKTIVTLFIRGHVMINGVADTLYVRLYKTGKIGFSVGMSKQKYITSQDKSNEKLKGIRGMIEKVLNDVFNVKVTEYKISNIATSGLSLVFPKTGDKPIV